MDKKYQEFKVLFKKELNYEKHSKIKDYQNSAVYLINNPSVREMLNTDELLKIMNYYESVIRGNIIDRRKGRSSERYSKLEFVLGNKIYPSPSDDNYMEGKD